MQRYASDPLVPGWGIFEPSPSVSTVDGADDHPAPLMPAAEALAAESAPASSTPDEQDAQPTDPSGDDAAVPRDRAMGWVAAGAVLLGVLVFVAIVVGQRLVQDTVGQQLSSLPGVRVATQLVAAGHAMDMYREQTGAYPTDLRLLADYGYQPENDVSVQLVPISGTGYCLAAGPAGEPPTAWYPSSAAQVVHSPCQ